MQEALTVIGSHLIQILGGIAIVLLGWLFKEIGDMVKITVIQRALDIITDSVINVIKSSVKEMKKEYKEAMKDGELSEAEVDKIKTIVLRKAQKEIPNVIKKLTGLTDDELEEYIIDTTERLLGEEIGDDIKKYL